MAALYGRIASYLLTRSIPSAIYIPKRSARLMNDPFEHATGLEKKMLAAEKEGNCDPFDMLVMKRGPGTKDNPNLIPSAFESRLVGCICDQDQPYIQYMWLTEGCPKRCECGHWFKLVRKDPLIC